MKRFALTQKKSEGGDICYSATRALCNTCGKLVEAKIVFRGQRVFLVKWCPEHGLCEALISSDRRWYQASLSYLKPRQNPVERAVSAFSGCPDSCGLCPEHQQHTCVPILEITNHCNMQCPICLVDGKNKAHLSAQEVEQVVEHLVRYEKQINMLTLSGGEPLLHPELLSILDIVEREEIGIVSISTNGLALLENDALIKTLRDRNVVISLQFDGFRAETSQILRNNPRLGSIKKRIIEKILNLGAKLSLTVTLAKGVNEEELEDILDLFFKNDAIVSMMIQPMALAGRAFAQMTGDPLQALTIPDVVRLLATNSRGILQQSDFTPLPCSHPSCFALTYLLKAIDGRLVALPRIIDAQSYLDIIKNQALLNTDPDTLFKIRHALNELWSSSGAIPDRDAVLKSIRNILLDLNRIGVKAPHSQVLDLGSKYVKSIFIHHFMDRFTFDLSRAAKCCNHYPQPDGKMLPACVRNNLDDKST